MSFELRIAIVIILTFILEFYFYRKLFNSIKFLFGFDFQKNKRLIFLILFPLNFYLILIIVYSLFSWINGERFRFIIENNLWDYFVLYPFWISIFIIIQSFFILLPWDIFRIILNLIPRVNKNLLLKINYTISFIAMFFFIIYVPFRVIYDYKAVEVRKVELQMNNMPAALKDFKIAFISDVQADWYTNDSRLQNYVNKVNETEPDLVLIAGDIITGTPDYIEKSAQFLGKLRADYGIFTCVGDHDNWAYRPDIYRSRSEITNALQKYNVEMIDNDTRFIKVDSVQIGISFITESYSDRISGKLLDSLTASVNTADLRILLTHQPTNRIIEKALVNNIDLMLAGHTHGGQVTFLFPFINLTPTLFETIHVKGDFFYDNMMLIVNRGLGMSLVPLRYNSTPEITLIEIVSTYEK
ncbi:MAG: metallophosphoesterase [Melioribacteraceae bacterium]|nr:metallophosphoesterase [Melioribacteraceae bacterium]